MINEIRTIVEKENEGINDPFSVTVTFPQNGILVRMSNNIGIELRIWYRNDFDCYETVSYHGSIFGLHPMIVSQCQSLVSQVFKIVEANAKSILESEE